MVCLCPSLRCTGAFCSLMQIICAARGQVRWREEGLGIELWLGVKVLDKVLRSREGFGEAGRVAS